MCSLSLQILQAILPVITIYIKFWVLTMLLWNSLCSFLVDFAYWDIVTQVGRLWKLLYPCAFPLKQTRLFPSKRDISPIVENRTYKNMASYISLNELQHIKIGINFDFEFSLSFLIDSLDFLESFVFNFLEVRLFFCRVGTLCNYSVQSMRTIFQNDHQKIFYYYGPFISYCHIMIHLFYF